MPQKNLTKTVASVVDAVRDFGAVVRSNPTELVETLQLVRRKFPAIKVGLGQVGKSDKTEVLSIGSFIERNARQRPHEPALMYEDRRYSHREVHEISNRYANLLKARGIRKGDAVGVVIENRPDIVFAITGIVKLGAIAAIINTNQRHNVLIHSLSLCDAKAFLVGEELYDAFSEVRGDVPAATSEAVMYVADTGDRPPPQDAVDVAAGLESVASTTPSDLSSVVLGDPCFYIYTSGTTGLPKASIMSHFRWVKAAGAFGKLALDLRSDETLYVPLPLYHNNALTVAWSSAASAGAAIALRRKFSATKFWDDIRAFDAKAFCYIGELCRYLMNQPNKPDDADNPVRKIVGNGLRPDIWKQFKQRFAIDEVYEFYGASEGNIAFVNVLNFDCTVGLCPAPYAIVEYDVDEDEPVRGPDGFMRRVQRGGVGLLIGEVSEKYAFDGYTDKAASEKKLLRDVFESGDVWFNSGDLLRDQGFKHAQFVDRVGDTFRWKSENVSTNEVAEVLNQFRHIEEATVYGVQIPRCEGRAGMAALVANVKPDDFDFAGLMRHVTSELPGYASPVFLRFRPQLEVTGTFKQKKGTLKKEGYDPGAVTDPVYVVLPRSGEYSRLTTEVFANISAGEIPF